MSCKDRVYFMALLISSTCTCTSKTGHEERCCISLELMSVVEELNYECTVEELSDYVAVTSRHMICQLIHLLLNVHLLLEHAHARGYAWAQLCPAATVL